MKKPVKKSFRHKGLTGKKEEEKLPGYPLYPETDDIYNKSIKVIKIDLEQGVSIIKAYEEKDLINDLLGKEITGIDEEEIEAGNN